MGWVTLDDGQHVYIGSGGKVLATRSAISATAGGRERMGAMRSKAHAAVHKALQRSHGKTAPTVEHAKAAGPTLREQADKARAGKGTAQERAQKIVERGKAIQTRLDQRSVAAGDAKDMDTWASTRGRMAYTNRHVSRVSETAEGPTARIQVASPGKPFKSSTMGQHSDWRSKPGTTLVSKPAQRTLHGDHDSMGDVTS